MSNGQIMNNEPGKPIKTAISDQAAAIQQEIARRLNLGVFIRCLQDPMRPCASASAWPDQPTHWCDACLLRAAGSPQPSASEKGDPGLLGSTASGNSEGPPSTSWQPIATAPKDGTEMLLVVDGLITFGGYVDSVGQGAEPGELSGYWWSVDGSSDPTLWHQIPAPPGGEAPRETDQALLGNTAGGDSTRPPSTPED